MNHQSAAHFPTVLGRAKTNGHGNSADADDTRLPTPRVEIPVQNARDLPEQLRSLPDWLRGRELGAETAQNDEFMTVFSHELRNSLCAIRFAVGILRMETSARPAASKARSVIEHQVEQMSRLVEDLLDASRARRGQLPMRPERVDLCTVVAHAAQAVEFSMEQRNHELNTSYPRSPVWLHADPARLEQVLVNLLLNAAKYTNPGGRIRLSAELDHGAAVVRVRDPGIGIAPEMLAHVFDLYMQADPTSRRVNAGLGIGLALVRSLVERHGGTVTAASAGLGHGSEFTVRLPLRSAPAPNLLTIAR